MEQSLNPFSRSAEQKAVTLFDYAKQKELKGEKIDRGEVARAALGTAMQEQQRQEAKILQEQEQQLQKQIAEQKEIAQQTIEDIELELENWSVQAQLDLRDMMSEEEQKLFDYEMNFQKDELGRTILNEFQLLDYARLKARNEEDFADYAQRVELVLALKQRTYESALRKISQAEEIMSKIYNVNKDIATNRQIAEIAFSVKERMSNAKAELQRRLQEEKRKAAKAAAGWGVFSKVFSTGVGIAVGVATGNPIAGVAAAAGAETVLNAGKILAQ